MQKKIIILVILIGAFSGGVLYWQKVDEPVTQISPTATITDSQTEYYEEGLIITNIDIKSRVISGKITSGLKEGQEIKLILKETGFYDKNENKVNLSYFQQGMIISARGYINIKQPGLFYPDFIREYTPGSNY